MVTYCKWELDWLKLLEWLRTVVAEVDSPAKRRTEALLEFGIRGVTVGARSRNIDEVLKISTVLHRRCQAHHLELFSALAGYPV